MSIKNLVTSIVTILVLSSFWLTSSSHAQQSIFDTSDSSLFSNENEFLKPEKAFMLNFSQSENELDINFDIAPGYYLYKKQFKFSSDQASYEQIVLPLGVEHQDEFFGVQQIYTEQLRVNVLLTQVDKDALFSITYQGCAEKGLCYPPITESIPLSLISHLTSDNANDNVNDNGAEESKNTAATSIDQASEQHQLVDLLQSGSLWVTLVAFFVGGLLLSFTPCVFPMYPILTGIIVGHKGKLSTKKAFSLSFVYVQGMAITYTLLGIVVALAGAQFQAMFQHPAVLIVLSVLFIFLALSMFGVFNLALPSAWQNKLNDLSNSQKSGSYLGVLMMGAISGLVASPCTTAPLTGALLYISQSGDIALGASALYALSLGMGLPLLLLGSSGGKLLPKAGNWMTVIKNIFGLLLLAVPIFLLERFIPAIASEILWISLLLVSASYFYAENQKTQVNLAYGLRHLVIFLLMFYGANQAYSLLKADASNHVSAEVTDVHPTFKRVDNLDQLYAAVELANQQGKTAMLDLYADWCIACKEFEELTFPEKSVRQALANTVWLQMDLTDLGKQSSKDIMTEFNLFGLPSILFFDLNAQELTQKRVTGFMKAEQFSAHINSFF
jgi:thiol:disulfide interchange protein DsbD